MERKIKRSVSPVRAYRLILTSDWHLRDDIPACRERDEYVAAMENKLRFIRSLCEKHQAILLHAGDLFDHWKPSPWLISLALKYLPDETIVVPGQHDLPGHNLAELGKTGLHTLQEAGRITVLSGGGRAFLRRAGDRFGTVYGYAFGEQAENPSDDNLLKVLLWHHLTCERLQPWPGAEASPSRAMKKQFSKYDLILTGDNHQQFTAGNWLVNPGSLLRMTSDQAYFEPAVYGWYDGMIERIPLPVEKGVVKIVANHAVERESRDARMDAYISRAQKKYEDRLSFEKNLERHFKQNEERSGVEEITWKAVGDEK